MSDMSEVFRWSFSQWENYDGCPQRWRFKSVLKLPTAPPGPAAARGLSMHDRAEKYILGEIDVDYAMFGNPAQRFGDKKPAVIHRKYIPILNSFRDHPNGERHTEKEMSFDPEWSPSGRMGKTLGGVKMVLDAARGAGGGITADNQTRPSIIKVGEWKSGQPKDSHKDQRHLYAVGALRWWLADAAEVTTYYLEDTAPPVKLKVTADDLPRMIKKWDDRVDRWRSDKFLAPKPGMHCMWCDFAKKKGGPCQFGG